MTCGGLRRIAELDPDAARFVWDVQIEPLFDTPHRYELLATMPMITISEPAPESSWRIAEPNANAISWEAPVAVAQ